MPSAPVLHLNLHQNHTGGLLKPCLLGAQQESPFSRSEAAWESAFLTVAFLTVMLMLGP